MLDLQTSRFKENLISEINESKLPATVVFYVLKELTENIATVMQKQIQEQRQAVEKKLGKDDSS